MGDGCRPFFHATPLGSGDSVPLAAELAKHGIFASLPKPDTRLISTTPPKAKFPFKADPVDDPWSDWPPAWWPPNPPPGWPPKRDIPEIPDEYWDFARRFMALCWRVVWHRVEYGYAPNAPWFNFGDVAMCQAWVLEMASQYIVLNWNSHEHATEGRSYSGEPVETFAYYRLRNLTANGWLSKTTTAALPMTDWEFEWYDHGAVDRQFSFASMAGIIESNWTNTLTFMLWESPYPSVTLTVSRSVGWHKIRFTHLGGITSIYYDDGLMVAGASAVVNTSHQVRTTAGFLYLKNMTYSINGGATQGPFYTATVGTGSGFSVGASSGTTTMMPITQLTAPTITIPGVATDDYFPAFDFYDVKKETFIAAMEWLDQLEAIVSEHGYGV